MGQKVALIGLGAMGRPMAACLARSDVDLAVFDVSPERTTFMSDLGVRVGTSASAAAEGREVIVVMVVDGEQARAALFDADGAVHTAAPGAIVLIMNTVGPDAIRQLDQDLQNFGLCMLDAPVSGGVRRAETGELLIMAGGPTERFEKVRPLLEVMGSTVVHCGENVGDGQAVKLVNQLLCGVHLAAAAEAMAYSSALDLDPARVYEVVRHGAAGSFMLDDRGGRMIAQEFSNPKSALNIFVKDMRLVLESAERNGFHAPLATAAVDLYELGAARGLGLEDDSGVIRVYEDQRGVNI